ncbi:hypothetical protein [Sphingomonas sp. BK580]|uniref:hypothetical protein n=1 Tax=Sphingomonas sp. BK580 TaxID=2586972 RepID=UPI001836D588|nr:hypothetical protein [Sphingomonas sp. BK580]MBB3695198.1 hypothetical protein [Sphingomonas sp. BK580]
MQGIAIDLRGGYIYYSFTNLLARYDFKGNLVGTLVGWHGHLGDLDFDPADGKVYGSLEYKKEASFYVAIIDVGRIDRVGMEAGDTDLFRTVYLPEVAADYGADLDGDGEVRDDSTSLDHRYGCSGIDGVAFGPAFGRTGSKRYLTVAYGIYGNTARSDNDHQVLLQYDISDWQRYARPLIEGAPHHRGPATIAGKYFVRTGNTRYGVQNLAYDDTSRRWFMGVYQGSKPEFPNYLLFAIDGRARPKLGDLVGVPHPRASGWAQGKLIALADEGMRDMKTGIRGWMQKADVGLQPIGAGQFYLATNSGTRHRQTADVELVRWTANVEAAFEAVRR